jgi:hypothetical protein
MSLNNMLLLKWHKVCNNIVTARTAGIDIENNISTIARVA